MGDDSKDAQEARSCGIDSTTSTVYVRRGSGHRAKAGRSHVTVSTGSLVTRCVSTVADMAPEANDTVRLNDLKGVGEVKSDQLHQVGLRKPR